MRTSTDPIRGADYRQAFVVCTDRGTHGRIGLGALTEMTSDGELAYIGSGMDYRLPGGPGPATAPTTTVRHLRMRGGPRVVGGRRRDRAGDPVGGPAHQFGGGTISMRCPKCRRESQLRPSNPGKLMDYLYGIAYDPADGRIPIFDISRMG